MTQIKKIKPNEDFTITIEYNDGEIGNLDISKIFEKEKYPQMWDVEYFLSADIDKKSGDVVWPDGINLCKNASYKIIKLNNMMSRLGLSIE